MNCRHLLITLVLYGNSLLLFSQRQMENLGRGVIALHAEKNKVMISWRMLGTDPDNIAFNLYRGMGSQSPVKLNNQPILSSTFWIDSTMDLSQLNEYFVKPLQKGKELEKSLSFKLAANTPVRPYLSIPLQPLEGYAPGDGSVGDLDGDGEYELVVKRENGGFNISQDGICPGTPKLEAYKLDGTFMWRIDLGINIREGAHYTNFLVYDFDGDGKSEIVVRTSEGTIDGLGNKIGDTNKDGVISYVGANGRILDGPEFLSVFNGKTGKELARTDYIPRGPRSEWKQTWGDDYGNRIDAQLAGVGYFDGIHPSILICRGYYKKSVLQAWNFQEGKLTKCWTFDTEDGNTINKEYSTQGNHNLRIGDVDNDGFDEVVYGACCIDHNGKGLYNTNLNHGDALHLSDMDPDRPGLEVFDVHEVPSQIAGIEFRDAGTGQLIWGKPSTRDVGRGMAADIDPRFKGLECWGSNGGAHGVFNCKGELISSISPCSINFGIWWDGDLLRELFDYNTIFKWNWKKSNDDVIFKAEDCIAINGSKSNPILSADILGDWREEVIFKTKDDKELRIFATSIPTNYRLYTLMHDPIYRISVATENVAYNQPPEPGFYLGEEMAKPLQPNISLVKNKT